jgi:hypothetical protein
MRVRYAQDFTRLLGKQANSMSGFYRAARISAEVFPGGLDKAARTNLIQSIKNVYF